MRPMRGRVYTSGMETTRHSQRVTPRAEGSKPRLGPWGVYGEVIGNPKSYAGGNPKDSEFLQAADEFMAAHEDALRELAKH